MKKWFRFVLIPLALGGVMVFLRWMDTFHVIQGKDVVFEQLHDFTWNNHESLVRRTGSDPYGWFKLPPEVFPLTSVTIDCNGAYVPAEGTYYFFPSPADNPERVLGAQTAATVENFGSSFTIRCALPPSKALRIDLPDFLARPIEIDRLEIRSAFWTWKSWRVRLAVICGATALIAAAALVFRATQSASTRGGPDGEKTAP